MRLNRRCKPRVVAVNALHGARQTLLIVRTSDKMDMVVSSGNILLDRPRNEAGTPETGPSRSADRLERRPFAGHSHVAM
jgi:hypothetical protein